MVSACNSKDLGFTGYGGELGLLVTVGNSGLRFQTLWLRGQGSGFRMQAGLLPAWRRVCPQGYFDHKKQRPPRTLQYDYSSGPMDGVVSSESRRWELGGTALNRL